MECTWRDCESDGTNPQLDNKKREWANLCQEHHDEIENSIAADPFEPKRLMRAWIKAQGGAKEASKRIF